MAHSFSNGVIETLTVKCKSIKTISVTVYSPPNSCCNLREWSDGCIVLHQGLSKQEELFYKFMSDKFLSNHVNRSTRLNNLLGLICSNVQNGLVNAELRTTLFILTTRQLHVTY